MDSVSRSSRLLYSISDALHHQGVVVEQLWAESGAGQFAIEVGLIPFLGGIDALYMVKDTVRALAQEAGLRATFIAKPSASSAASMAKLRFFCEDDDSLLQYGRLGLAIECLRIGSASAFSAANLVGGRASLDATGHMILSCDVGPTNVYLLVGSIFLLLAEPAAAGDQDSVDVSAPPADLASALSILEKSEVLASEPIIKCYVALKKAELEVKATLPVLLERF